MYFINDTKKLQIFKTVSVETLKNLQISHKDHAHDLFWAYSSLVLDNMPVPENMSEEDLWKKLTKPQKVIFTLGMFISQTNNGGIWQFFFNKTEYMAAAGVALETINRRLVTMYFTKVYKEVIAMFDNGAYAEICAVWDDPTKPFEERWKAFKSGETHLTHHIEFQEYFYDEKNKIRFYETINEYIEKNLGKLIVVEGTTTVKVIDKKAAIPHFTDYLTQYYGVAPTEVTVYYTGNVTIESTGTKLFLMRFTMPDGYESLGITGYFTHHFDNINWADIKKMYQSHHKQALVNYYYGWYLVEKVLRENPKSTEVDVAKWNDLLARLQVPTKTQIPVNVQFMKYFKYDEENEWYFYTGDLLYNEKPEILPKDLTNVEVLSVHDKKIGDFSGELNRLFSTKESFDPSFGRQNPDEPVESKNLLAVRIGKMNKLLKDNPWGF